MGTKRAMTISMILFLGLSMSLMADGKTDFSGIWVLDPARSELGSGGRGLGSGGFGGGGGGRLGEGGRRRRDASDRPGMGRKGKGGEMGNLTIDHREPQLIIRQTISLPGEEQVRESEHTTNGRELTREGFGGTPARSKTYWEGTRLVTETSMETPMGSMESREVRSLSDDGKVMTVERTTRRMRGERTRKFVYVKRSSR